jgi:hypothetical protein
MVADGGRDVRWKETKKSEKKGEERKGDAEALLYYSLAGNRTRVAAVTRQNTSLYTTKEGAFLDERSTKNAVYIGYSPSSRLVAVHSTF